MSALEAKEQAKWNWLALKSENHPSAPDSMKAVFETVCTFSYRMLADSQRFPVLQSQVYIFIYEGEFYSINEFSLSLTAAINWIPVDLTA